MVRQSLLTALGVGAVLLGLFLLYRVFRRYDFNQVLDTVATMPAATALWALFWTAAGYGCLIAMERLGLLYAGRPVATTRLIRTTVAALGIGHAIGLAFLSSGAVRYRMYRRGGLDIVAVGKVIFLSGVSVSLGLATVGGFALLWQGDALAPLFSLSPELVQAVAIGALIFVVVYVVLCAVLRHRIRVGKLHMRLPTFRIALGQVVFSSCNILCVAAVLYVGIRSFVDVDYPTVAALYVGSDVSGVIGHVPGGWGVLEYIVTHALDRPEVLSGIVVFRAAYYLFPLAVGLLVFVHDEIAGGRRGAREVPPLMGPMPARDIVRGRR